MRPLPFKARLILWYLGLSALIVACWSAGIVSVVRGNLYTGIDGELKLRASQITRALAKSKDGELVDFGDSAVAQLLSKNGRVLDHSGAKFAVEPIVERATVDSAWESSSARFATVERDEDRYRLLVAKMPGTKRLIVVGAATESADDAVSRLVLVMLLTGAVVLVAAGTGGWLLVGRALVPMTEMTSTAASVNMDRLDERVNVPPGNDELAALAVTFNKMLDRLEAGVGDKRRLVADASHELQTPLAVMRTELDVSLASPGLTPESVAVLESAREETDRMTRIVRNLLTLARFDEGTIKLLRKPINMLALVTDSVATLSGLAAEREVEVTVGGDDIVVLADPEYVRLVVVNLLENAVKHSDVGTSVIVTIESVGDEARISVTDTGPGIPEEDQPHVFDRFYRIDRARSKARGGSGLGLAISKEIVEAHEGRVELKSRVGEGSTFRVVLPIVPVAARPKRYGRHAPA